MTSTNQKTSSGPDGFMACTVQNYAALMHISGSVVKSQSRAADLKVSAVCLFLSTQLAFGALKLAPLRFAPGS